MKLLLEGWRGIGQSLAIVNQFQALALLRRGDVSLFHRDMPTPLNWNPTRNGVGFPAAEASEIAAIPAYRSEPVDAVYRIVAPTRSGAPDDRRLTVTFKVTEMGVDARSLAPGTDLGFLTRDDNVVVTPTVWSLDRLVEAGFPAERVRIVPHGVDRRLFSPVPLAERADLRARFGFADDETVLLNIGGPFWNKGPDLLLEAFAILRARGRRVRLMLKDQSSLYGLGMHGMIAQVAARRPELASEENLAAISLFQNNLDFAQLREMFALADCYVSPYRAEGFNLPALEAIACGLPVIVTSGGATDDFCPEPLVTRIAGKPGALQAEPGFPPPRFVEPDLDSLVEAMEGACVGPAPGSQDRDAQREQVLKQFSWDRAAELILVHAGAKPLPGRYLREAAAVPVIRTSEEPSPARRAAARRSGDGRYATRWLVGDGIDIAPGFDPLENWRDLFPLMRSVRTWSAREGDLTLMPGVADGSYDFVHASLALAHLADPAVALGAWIRICRPGGMIVLTVPDEDLEERPPETSRSNVEPQWTFTIAKRTSRSPRSVSVLEFMRLFIDDVEVVKIELLDAGFRYDLPPLDRARESRSESAIEIVLRRRAKPLERQSAPPGASDAFAQAVALHGAGETGPAAALYRTILAREPDNVAALSNLSLLADTSEAESLLRRAIALNPSFMASRLNLGRLLMSTGRVHEASDCFSEMIEEGANDSQIFMAHASALEAQDRIADAAHALERALELDATLAEAAVRLGKLREREDRTEAAVAAYDRAITAAPRHAQAHVLRGFAHLKLGDYRRGGEGLAWIWSRTDLGYPPDLFAAGADMSGRTIVLSSDASLGDALMFVRYAALLRERGARVVVECQPELHRLFASQTAISAVVPIGGPLPSFDWRVPMHDLIRTFGTSVASIPSASPYLIAPAGEASAWRTRLEALPGLKAGLVWAGDPTHEHDARRTLRREWLAPLREIDGVSFVSLQRGASESDLPDFSAEMPDMAATAALVGSLDLVITVDTSMAHLAGALGRPAWLLNRFDGCWRWLRARDDSPWYPSLRQFRQSRPGDWADVVNKVTEALEAELARDRNSGENFTSKRNNILAA